MTHDLCVALCAHHLQSHPLPSCIWPPLAFTTLHAPPSGNHHTVVCVCEFQFHIPLLSEIIWFLTFSNWLILLSMIFSGFIHVVANSVFHLSLRLSSVSIVYMCHIFSIQSPIDGHLGCLRVLATMNNVAVNKAVPISLQRNVFEFLGRCPDVGFLGHMVTLFLICKVKFF